MRTKLLRGKEGVTVQLLYPSTLDEYRQVLDALGGGRPAVATGVAALRSRQIAGRRTPPTWSRRRCSGTLVGMAGAGRWSGRQVGSGPAAVFGEQGE